MQVSENINWQKEALDLLANLFLVKQQKDFSVIYRDSVDLACKHAHADFAAIVRLEDKLTARVLYSSKNFVDGFLDAGIIGNIIDSKEIAFTTGESVGKGSEEVIVFLPVADRAFSGCFVLHLPTNFVIHEQFREFLAYAWIGLKETTMLLQTYYFIEQLSTRFNAILGTIPEGIVFVDDSGKQGWLNAPARKLLGLTDEDSSPLAIAAAMQRLRGTAVNQEAIIEQGEQLFSSPNQTIKNWEWIFGDPINLVLNVSCVPATSANITGRLWVFDDVTTISLANQQLKELNVELADKRRIADEQNKAKSDFLANMSHEIRTPMNGVIGMASLLMETQLNEEQVDFVETIRISGEALLSIINDILDFSKIESGKMDLDIQPVTISNVIEETYDLLSVKANEKGLDMLYYIDPSVPGEILGDEVRLKQILVNLVNNGLKFTNIGELLVTVNTSWHEGDWYNLEFTVKDTGIGIPKDKFHKLFELFSQVDSSSTRKHGGTGLGLAICQRLVTLMGGTIRAESEVGVGSTFTFNIHVQASRRPIKYNRDKGTRAELKDKRILILDDNKTNLKILSTQCDLWGMRSFVTTSYEDAIKEAGRSHFDLAIIDLLMPEKNGIDVSKELKAVRKDLPLILFSSAGYCPEDALGTRSMFAAILNKPVKQALIERTFIDVLSRCAPLLAVGDRTPVATVQEKSPINILVAEDNDVNQKMILRALDRLGYKADLAENGKQVLALMEKATYQLVFMDVMMPEMDGYEATKRIWQQYSGKERPVIVAMTANALAGDREKILTFGMDDYISKPFKLKDIEEKMDYWKPKLLEKL